MSKSGRFVFVPAAMENDLSGVGFYITYHKHRDGPIRVIRQTGRYIWIDCPDREIVIQRERYYASDPVGKLSLHPENYDEYLHLDVNNSIIMKDLNLEFSMLNATSVTGSGDRRGKEDRNKSYTKMMVDSGGYQLFSGTADFVDPVKVIKTHNLHGDLGMVLDIPVPEQADIHLAKKLLWAQKKNTELMMKHKRDDLNLVNIFHGSEPDIYRMYREEVERDDINHVAFGFTRKGSNSLRGIRKVTDLLTMKGKQYEQYHILGVSDLVKTLPLIWLAKLGVVPLITSDSSTHVRCAANGMYLLYSNVRSTLQKIEVSRKWTRPSRYTTLPCSCVVCSRLKYSDAMPFISGSLMTRLLMFHNLTEHVKYFDTIWQVAVESKSIEEFLGEIKYSITKDRHEEARIGMQIAEVGVNDGMKEVDKRFHYHIHKTRKGMSGLFDADDDSNSGWGKIRTRALNNLKKYKAYHAERQE